MIRKKRVFLVGNSSPAPESVFTDILKKYPGAYLDPHPDCESFLILSREDNVHTQCSDETLLIVNSAIAETIQEQLSSLNDCMVFKNLPIVVLLRNCENEFARHCYINPITGIVLLSEEENILREKLTDIFDFWLGIAVLPRNMLAVERNQNSDTIG